MAALLLATGACTADERSSAGKTAPPLTAPPSDGGSDGHELSLPTLGGALAGLGDLDRQPPPAARARLVDAAEEAVDIAPSGRDPLLITDTEDVFVEDAQRAWTLALAYRFTQDPAYGEAADAYVRDWMATRTLEEICSEHGGCPTSLMVSRAAPGFVFAAEILQSEGLWDEADTEELHSWLRDVMLPAASDRDNNWGDAGTYMRVAIAAELGDDDELEAAADRLVERIEMIRADGQIPEEVRRETGSLMYSQESLGYKLASVDMLARSGIDVWDHVGDDGGSLRAALDLVARSLEDPSVWPVVIEDLRIPRPAAMWAIAAQRFDDERYAALADEADRNDGSGHSAVLWTSVTHSDR